MKSKTTQNQIRELEKRLDFIDKLTTELVNEETRLERKLLKKELDSMYEQKAAGYQVRSRAQWVEKGEKSTSYFLGLEKSRQNSNCIECLKDSNGESQHSDDNILHIAKTFYENLYTSNSVPHSDIETYYQSLTFENILDDINKENCEGLVTYNECETSLNKMKKNKSPGLDGLTTEFYQTFWPVVGNLLINVFNESYENGNLPDTQKKAVMSLIFKKDDEENIANYRPISLTNVDYRILALTLAQRMLRVMSDIISYDQSAYVKGRYMGTNIRLVSDIIDHYDMTYKSGILLMLDFKKAFDTIEWEFMFKALHSFNFGPSFIRWIQTIYNSPVACIKNNGYFSESFKISRGIRQGCTVSALIFILCVEVLAIKVRNSNSLHGFQFGYEKPIKIAQYADDGILFLNDRNEMCSALNILEIFGNLSGLILNLEKCEGLWLGRSKHLQIQCNLFGIKWPKQFRCLGIYLGHDKSLNNKKNFYEKIDQIEDILKKWEKRDLSLFGRVQILKTFAVSKIVLPVTTQCVPDGLVKKINKIFYQFLWRSHDKVSRNKVMQDVVNGGLNMMDMQLFFNALKASWINRIQTADPNTCNWVQLPKIYLYKLDEQGLNFRFNFDESVIFDEVKDIPGFYKQPFKYYNKASVCDENEFEKSIMSQPLFGNKFITTYARRKNRVLFLRNWIRGGIRKVGDLVFSNGILDERFIYQKLIVRQNIYCDILLVKNALLPYQQCIMQGNNDTSVFNRVKLQKSKDYYNMFKFQSAPQTDTTRISNYLIPFCNKDEEVIAFTKNVALGKEIKLKEFSFKVLHGILPCNLNLMRWKISDSHECDICGETQSIEHLLYSCVYVRPLWQIVELGLDEQCEHDDIITIVSFLIYKDWLLPSLQNKNRNSTIALSYFKAELTLRQQIYESVDPLRQHI